MSSRLHRYRLVLWITILGTAQSTILTALPLYHCTGIALRFEQNFSDAPLPRSNGAGVPEAVATDLARRILRIERLRSRLASEQGFLRAADDETLLLLFNRSEGKNELLRGYSPSLGADVVPPDLFKHLDLAIDALWIEITRLAPTYTATDGHPLMQTLSDALEQRLRVAVPKATFVGGMLREKEWQVKLSALGLPESRCMSGVLFYRLDGQPWLICREFEVSQKYFKRSATSGPGEISLGCLRLQQNA